MRYSALALAWNALTGQTSWTPAWRDAAPREAYDVVVVGGGGHGLATAYYLAKEHGITNVAVLEKSWIGSGNAGRNTTIIRSNYLLPGNIPFYEWSMKLWEGLEQDLNYNAMVSQRGVLNLYHSDVAARRLRAARQRHAAARRRCRAARPRRRCARSCRISISTTRAFRSRAACCSGAAARRAMTRWCGATRAAPTGAASTSCRTARSPASASSNGRVTGVETTRGVIRADKVALAVAGSSSRVAAMAGLRLPIESHVLQAFVSEGIKPLIDHVITFGAGHFYISQSDKGGLVFGGDIDGYNSYAQRGNLPVVEDVCEGGMALMPMLGRLRVAALVGRHHGHVDGRLADHRPHAGRGPLSQCRLVLRRLQGDAGLRLVLRAPDRARRAAPGAAAYRLDRFATGRLIDERGAGAQPNLHLRAEQMRIACPTLRRARRARVRLSGRRDRAAPRSAARRTRSRSSPTTSICATTRPARTASSGITAPVPGVARGHARHAHARDRRVESLRAGRSASVTAR